MALYWGLPGWAGTRRNIIHSHLSWSLAIHHLSPSTTIHCNLPPHSICMFYCLIAQPLSKFWSTSGSGTLHFILHAYVHPVIIFISQHFHTITTCFAVVLRLSFSLLELSVTLTLHIFWSDYSHFLPIEVPSHFLSLQGATCHFHATYSFAHNCSLDSHSMIYRC